MLAEIPIHPIIVHCPIALITLALFCELLEIIFKKKDFGIVVKWSLLFGAIGALFAFGSGVLAARIVEHNEEIHQVMEHHASAALVVVITSIVLTIWRFLPAENLFNRFRYIFTILLIVLVIFLARAGYLGGKLVYGYGLGVKKSIATPSVTEGGEQKHEGHKHSH